MKWKKTLAGIAAMTMFGLLGCNRSGIPSAEAAASTATGNEVTPAAEPPAPPPPVFTLETGVSVPVRLQETLDTRRNRSGDRFTATLDEPLVSGDRVVVPKGTLFSGHITEARSSGRFKGRGVMALTLDSFTMNGQSYPVRVARSARVTGGHKKRNWFWIGGTSGGGAALGAIAGGGAGALIGAGAGAAAGTVGAIVTGKKQVVLPIETRLSFKLQSPVQING